MKKKHAETPQPPETTQHEGITKERDELVDHLQRLQAEFDNYRKRLERDHDTHKEQATDGLLQAILPILDNLHLAIAHAKTAEGSTRGEELLSGVLLIKEQLEHLLRDHGLSEIPTDGQRFDPQKHEALMTQTQEGTAPNTIIQTLQRGYARGERTIRPAKVIVAR